MSQADHKNWEAGSVSRKKQEGVRVGNITVLAQPNEQRLVALKQLLIAQSYEIKETAHFAICQKPAQDRTILMHMLNQAQVDADLICIVENELSPAGMLSSARDYSAVLFAVMASTFPAPRNQSLIWRHFCLNTLTRMRELIYHQFQEGPCSVSHIVPFATIYQRIMALFVGKSLLDVGSSFGFLPVLMAEYAPHITIVGYDNNPDAIKCSTDLAAITHVGCTNFLLQDALSEDFPIAERFDTVTAVHLLEHVTEQELPVALTHLLRVTNKRLLIAVPYEQTAQALYGHQQVFTPEKLDWWGKWCVEAIKGEGNYWCEDVMGGLLVIERFSH